MSRKDCCFILCILCLVLSYYKIFFIWWAELYKHQFFAMIFWRTDTDDVSTKAFFYHIKQIDSMLWVWTVIDPKWSQNMVGTSGHTQLHFRCKFFVLTTFWHHLWSITTAGAMGNLFVKFSAVSILLFYSVMKYYFQVYSIILFIISSTYISILRPH